MIILHSKHSKESRDFVSANENGNTVIDWYGEDDVSKALRNDYMSKHRERPTRFPMIVDEDSGYTTYSTNLTEFENGILEDFKQKRIEDMRSSYSLAMTTGVTDDALGSNHVYPLETQDQIDLIVSGIIAYVTAAGTVHLVWCKSVADGTWGMRSHTEVQMKGLLVAMGVFLRNLKQTLSQKIAAIEAAITVEEVNLITWN